MRRLLIVLGCGLAAFVLVAEARVQEPSAPTFRASTDLVDVDVSVLDRDRLPVRGLTAGDFTVLEDGQPRPIVAFSAVALPPRVQPPARWMADVAPDVLDNDLQREGRLVVILIDRSINFEDLPATQRFAEAVVDQLRPGDLAAVAYSTFGVPQNFTADRQRLLAAIRQPLVGLPAADGGAPSVCRCGACSLETIAGVAEALAPVRQRRKMLLVIGSNISIQSSGACSANLNPARERAFRALDAGNVTVYAFDPGGLPTLSASADYRAAAGDRRRRMANLTRLGNLMTLPDRTGGRLLADPVRPADRVAEIFRESDAYYVLGFQPAHPEPDGRFHRIRVRVNRPSTTLQARRGYYGGLVSAVAAGRTDDEDGGVEPALGPGLRGAVSGLWPKGDIALSIAAAPLAAPDLSGGVVAAVVKVRQDIDDSVPPDVATALAAGEPTRVNVFTGAFDRQGRALASTRQTVSVTAHRTAPRSFEYEVVSRLDLPAGRYELRTAVEDTRLGRSGSVYTYVDVPDYRREPVALSGLLLTSQPAPVSVPAGALDGLLSIVPTTRRSFTRADRATAFVRLYQGVSRAMMAGYVVAEILDDRERSVYRQETRLVPTGYGASRAVDFSVELPLDTLPPGEYVLGVEARHGNETARRDTRFSVRE